jgi:putative PIN family toxin of toxin-antitoxin system
LFVSREILGEVLEVLRRQELASKFRGLAGLDIVWVLEIVGAAEPTEAAQVERGSRDHNDDKFLGATDAVHADYLVSEDHDLQVLVEYAGARIVGCEEFLDILERDGARPY